MLAGATGLIALLALSGWMWQVRPLTSLHPEWVTMKPNTAVGLLLCAMGLGSLSLRPGIPLPLLRVMQMIPALAVFLLGVTALAQDFLETNWGIDNLLFVESPLPGQTTIPGRMAPSTAMAFLFFGTALGIHAVGLRLGLRAPLVRGFAVGIAFIGGFALVGHATSFLGPPNWWTGTGVAANTAVCLVMLGVGLFLHTNTDRAFRWHIEPVLTGGFAVGILFLTLVLHSAHTQIAELRDTAALVAHRHHLLRTLRAIDAERIALENIQRGYLITADEGLLPARKASRSAQIEDLAEAMSLVMGDPEQTARARRLSEACERRFEWEEQTLAQRRSGGPEVALPILTSPDGERTMAAVLSLIDELRAVEDALLVSDSAAAQAAVTRAFLMLPLGVFLSVTVLTGCLFFLNAGLSERARAADALRASLSSIRKHEKELERSEARYRVTLDSMIEGCQILDWELTYLYVNHAAAMQNRKSRAALLGRKLTDVWPGIQESSAYRLIEQCRSERTMTREEIEFEFPDGRRGWFEVCCQPIPEGVFVFSVETTERHKARQEILALNADLEARIAARTKELQALNAELESFCYSVSHDLRAPLRAIAGFTQILSETCASGLDDTSRDYFDRVLKAADRMGLLIDDLLMLSRVSREEMKLEPTNLSAIATEILRSLAEADPARDVSWTVQPDLVATCDPRLLRIALDNLLGNAWKFSSRTPMANISFTGDSSPAEATFTVADNGVGFDMRYAGKLFSPFQRLHGMSEFPGTGIGLATVQRIIHRHGGRVWAEAALGSGAQFSFTLNTR